MTKFVVLSVILGSLVATAQTTHEEPLGSLAGSAQMTHEETVVRTAYAKYAYAVAQGVITDLAMEAMSPIRAARTAMRDGGLTSEQRLTAGTITFLLSDFTFGSLRDIMDRQIADFESRLRGEVLQVATQKTTYNKTVSWTSIEVQWHKAPEVDESQALTFNDLQREMQKENQTLNSPGDRYASYTVTLTYQGQTRTYKAMFLFGHDSQGKENVRPADPIADDTGLAIALATPLFPDGLARTQLRNQPVVQGWLNANQMANSSCSVLLSKGDVCCDLVRMRCGPGRDDLAEALAKPTDEQKGRE
jgi:hypothetical protein